MTNCQCLLSDGVFLACEINRNRSVRLHLTLTFHFILFCARVSLI